MPIRNPKFVLAIRQAGIFNRYLVESLSWNGGLPQAVVAGQERPWLVDFLTVYLLEWTGCFDRNGAEIYHGHILASDEGDIYMVTFFNGSFWLQQGISTTLMEDATLRKLKIVGDVFSDSHLILPEGGEELLKDVERKNLPPIIRDFKIK